MSFFIKFLLFLILFQVFSFLIKLLVNGIVIYRVHKKAMGQMSENPSRQSKKTHGRQSDVVEAEYRVISD